MLTKDYIGIYVNLLSSSNLGLLVVEIKLRLLFYINEYVYYFFATLLVYRLEKSSFIFAIEIILSQFIVYCKGIRKIYDELTIEDELMLLEDYVT